jgi:hypothetical protein
MNQELEGILAAGNKDFRLAIAGCDVVCTGNELVENEV